jgi:hypothetical protein
MQTWTEWSYPIFLYVGIVFIVIHLFIYGLGLDQSYFGLILALVGYFRTGIYGWVLVLLWMGMLLEGTNLGKTIYNKYLKPKKMKKRKPIKDE